MTLAPTPAPTPGRLDPLAIGLPEIESAQRLIAEHVQRTPLTHSRTLSAITGAEVWVKFENHQFTASFKERGALNRLLRLAPSERRTGVIAMSAGNHAQAVAYHGQRLGLPVTIVMPRGTPFIKVEQTEGHGARVILDGETLTEAQTFAETLAAKEGLTFLHPYDDPLVMAGQGTIGLEMLAEQPGLETLVVPIGGGGLISGIATAAKALKPAIEIVGVEARRYASARAALDGKPDTSGGDTIAEGIAVKNVGKLTLPIIRALVADIVTVDEIALERAIALFLNVEKTVAEGAGAAGLAALLAHAERFRNRRVGLVLCGGNIDPRLLATVIMREMVRERRIIVLRVQIPDRPGGLARIATAIGEEGGNIVEVLHQRIFTDAAAKATDIDMTIETRGRPHADRIIARLKCDGLDVTVLDPVGTERRST